VVRQHLGLGVPDIRKSLGDCLGDPAVEFVPPAPEQRVVGGILQQGVFEAVDRVRRRALMPLSFYPD
jgi:hypothetical protein